MLGSDWRSYAAIGGLIGFFCLASILSPYIADFVLRYSNPVQSVADGGNQQHRPDNAPATAPKENQQPAADYKPDCSKSTEADLCAQRRMAKSAEDQVGISQYGLILLLATLAATVSAAFFTGATWWTMKGTAKRELRAYVFAVPHLTFVPKKPPKYKVSADNVGKTPAYQARMWARSGVSDYPLKGKLPRAEAIAMTRTVIPPGDVPRHQLEETFPAALTDEEEVGVQNGTRGIYIWGEITYLDAFGDEQHTPFQFVHNGRGGALELTEEGNEAT